MPDLDRISFFGFILMRISGFIMFNPILIRRNVPGMIKGVFIMCITVFAYYYIPYTPVEISGALEYMVLLAKEALAGLAIGFVCNIFASVVIGACEIIDNQMGLGMAKMYDPQSNIQIGVTSNMYNTLFMLIFFSMGCHLNLIDIFLSSYKIIPYGNVSFFTTDLVKDIMIICINSIEMSVRFALPILAVELFMEMGVGLLMKAVPQINVFIVNIQLKLVLGLIMMIVALPMFSDFLTRIIDMMFSAAMNILKLMV